MSELRPHRNLRRRVEHPFFAPLIACALHGIGLASLGFVHVSAPETIESMDEETASFTLDLRGTPLVVTEDAAQEPAAEDTPTADPANEVVEPPVESPPEPQSVPIARAPEIPVEAPIEEPPVMEPVPDPTPVVAQEPPPATEPILPPTPALETGVSAPVPAPIEAGGGVPAEPVSSGPPPPDVPAPPTSVPSTSGAAPGSATAGGLGGDAPDDGKALRARSTPRPAYPSGSRKRGEQGTVVCRLTIDRSGRVVAVEVVTSSGFPDLDESAVRALERWRFEPLDRLTTAERVRALQRLTFELARSAR